MKTVTQEAAEARRINDAFDNAQNSLNNIDAIIKEIDAEIERNRKQWGIPK